MFGRRLGNLQIVANKPSAKGNVLSNGQLGSNPRKTPYRRSVRSGFSIRTTTRISPILGYSELGRARCPRFTILPVGTVRLWPRHFDEYPTISSRLQRTIVSGWPTIRELFGSVKRAAICGLHPGRQPFRVLAFRYHVQVAPCLTFAAAVGRVK
jgi:hypothetical protein